MATHSESIYAPKPTEVTVTNTLETGTKVGTITVDGVAKDLFVPSGGGSGSTVSFTPTVESGTEIGSITIDGVEHKIYAPEGTVVSFEALQSTGTKIGTITIGGTSTDIYAPGGVSDVSWTGQYNETNGVLIGTLTITE